jgi:hypothetical protein
VSGRRLLASSNNRAGEDGAAKTLVSCGDNYRLFVGVIGDAPERILASVFKNQSYCIGKILSRFFPRHTLAVSSGNLGTISNEPFTVLLEYCSELVTHGTPQSLHCLCNLRIRQEKASDVPIIPVLLSKRSMINKRSNDQSDKE